MSALTVLERRFGRGVAPAALTLAGLAVLGNCLRIGYLSDDFDLMARATAADFSFFEPFPAGGGAYWRPLTLWILRLTESVIGGPAAHHAVNLAGHLGCGLLAYSLANRLAGRGLALPLALLFTVHFANVTDVYWISGRTDGLCALFFLAGLRLFLDYPESGRPHVLALSWLYVLAALLCKETAVIFPLALVACAPAFARLDDPAVRRRWIGGVALHAATALVFGAWVFFRFHAGEGFRVDPLNLPDNLVKSLFFAVSPVSAQAAKANPALALVAAAPLLAAGGWILWAAFKGANRAEAVKALGLILLPLIALAPGAVFLDGADARLLYMPIVLGAISLAGLAVRAGRGPAILLWCCCVIMAVASYRQGLVWRANQRLADACADSFVQLAGAGDPERFYLFLTAPGQRRGAPVFANDLNRHLYHRLHGSFGKFPHFGYVGFLMVRDAAVISGEEDWRARRFVRRVEGSGAFFNLGPDVPAGAVHRWKIGTAEVLTVREPGKIETLRFTLAPRHRNRELWVFDFDGVGFELAGKAEPEPDR